MRVGVRVNVGVGTIGVIFPPVGVKVGVKIAVCVKVGVTSVGVNVGVNAGGISVAVLVGTRPGSVGNKPGVGKKPPGKVGMGVTSGTGVLSAMIKPGMSAGLSRSPSASSIRPTLTGGSAAACKSAL